MKQKLSITLAFVLVLSFLTPLSNTPASAAGTPALIAPLKSATRIGGGGGYNTSGHGGDSNKADKMALDFFVDGGTTSAGMEVVAVIKSSQIWHINRPECLIVLRSNDIFISYAHTIALPNLKVGDVVMSGNTIGKLANVPAVCGPGSSPHVHLMLNKWVGSGNPIHKFPSGPNWQALPFLNVCGKSFPYKTDADTNQYAGAKIPRCMSYTAFNGNWYLNPNNAASDNKNLTAFIYGMSNDIPLVGDWNGDGISTPGVFRPSNATWYLNPNNATSNNTNLTVFQYAMGGDIPIVGDWNGDGIDTVGVFRPSEAKWYLNPNNAVTDNTNLIVFQYGLSTDIPIVGDWNGDGIDTAGVFRPSEAKWYLNPKNAASNNTNLIIFQYGIMNDTPLVGDWNGDGIDTVGVAR